MSECVRACVRACERACERACVRACVCVWSNESDFLFFLNEPGINSSQCADTRAVPAEVLTTVRTSRDDVIFNVLRCRPDILGTKKNFNEKKKGENGEKMKKEFQRSDDLILAATR